MDFKEKNCRSCKDRQSCRDVFRSLGQSDAPPVALKAIIAFLLPVLIFIASLFIADKLLKQLIKADSLAMILGFVGALFVTFIYILCVRPFFKKDRTNLSSREDKDEHFGN